MPLIALAAISDNSSEFGDRPIYRLFRNLSISATRDTGNRCCFRPPTRGSGGARDPERGRIGLRNQDNSPDPGLAGCRELPAVSADPGIFSDFTGDRKPVVLEFFK
jgi:hypothetical protein